MTGVVAVALASDRLAELAGLDVTSLPHPRDLPAALAAGGVDVVVYDPAVGDGWPVDNAVAVADMLGPATGLILLCGSAVDVAVLGRRLPAATVWPAASAAVAPGGLPEMIAGLAARIAAIREGPKPA